MVTAEEYEKMSAAEKKKEDWMNSKWRPMMGWLYMATCTFDFVVFPILWSLLQSTMGHPVTQWQPLTLQGAGLYHIAMGAVLGLAAFGRTQEKLAGANNGGLQPTGQSVTATFGTPSAGGFGNSGGFTAPAASSFGSQSSGGSPVSRVPGAFGAASAGAAGGLAVASTMPMVGKPADTGPIDDDYMPPRE